MGTAALAALAGRPRRSAEATRERQCPGAFCNDGAVVGNGVRKTSCERAGRFVLVACNLMTHARLFGIPKGAKPAEY